MRKKKYNRDHEDTTAQKINVGRDGIPSRQMLIVNVLTLFTRLCAER